jgi:hypothetical protein
MEIATKFKVVAVSENSNSFGLKQMIMVSESGITCKGCFNYLNIKEKGDLITGYVNELMGRALRVSFPGGELVEMGDELAPREVLRKLFKG